MIKKLQSLPAVIMKSIGSRCCVATKSTDTMPNSTKASPSPDLLHGLDEEKRIPDAASGQSTSNAEPTQPESGSRDEITYPEGGLQAWLVVFGAFCGLTSSLGIYNTSGVFSAVVSETVLPGEAPSTLAWLFSTYAFVNWFLGVQVGPAFDSYGPRALITAGTVCTLAGIFCLSVSTRESCSLKYLSCVAY